MKQRSQGMLVPTCYYLLEFILIKMLRPFSFTPGVLYRNTIVVGYSCGATNSLSI